VTVSGDGRCRVRTEAPQRAVTPGQSAVFYDGEACLGGGVVALVRDRTQERAPAATAAATP
jgi:tRNA-specific 2-thiouridylase